MPGKEQAIKNPVPKNFQNNTITGSKGNKKTKQQVLAPVADGAIGSTDRPIDTSIQDKPKKVKSEKEMVAIFSGRNANWSGVGRVSVGYNIVTRDAANAWLGKSYIREATPEEVAREYGK